MDGERIIDGEGTVGYIHRAFEKIAEKQTFLPNHTFNGQDELLFGSHQQYGMVDDFEKSIEYRSSKKEYNT